MTRRISIARDGTVKLGGKATRWRAEPEQFPGLRQYSYLIVNPDGGVEDRCYGQVSARAYLASLTDDELMA